MVDYKKRLFLSLKTNRISRPHCGNDLHHKNIGVCDKKRKTLENKNGILNVINSMTTVKPQKEIQLYSELRDSCASAQVASPGAAAFSTARVTTAASVLDDDAFSCLCCDVDDTTLWTRTGW